MKKAVFFDIDGTLLDSDKRLPEKTKKAIKLLQESGVFVAIATGRGPFMFEELREELGISSFVCFNGQYVVLDGKKVYSQPFPEGELKKLIDFSKEKKHPSVFLDEYTMKANVEYHPYIEESLASLKCPHPDKDENYFMNSRIYQSLLFCEDGEEEDYVKLFDQFRFIRWHEFSVDVLPGGGSKAAGIKKVADLIGIPMENIYAFGDGLNDIEMLQAVGVGVAMGNAHPEVKKHAEYITKDVSEDGIWEGLKDLGLI